MKTLPHSIALLCSFLLFFLGCQSNFSTEKQEINNLTSLLLEEAEGTLILEVPDQIGQLGQHAVLAYLEVFSFTEIAEMAEDLRIKAYLKTQDLSPTLALLTSDRSMDALSQLSSKQIADLNAFQINNSPQNCYSSYRYKWQFSEEEWSTKVCGHLQECIGPNWIALKAQLCVVSHKEDAPIHWATSFP